MKTNKIIIFDTTLRDGEQSPGASLNIQEKVEVAQQLARLGVDVIEAGFPVASSGDFTAVKLVAQKVRGPVVCGLARARKEDLVVCWQAVKYADRPRIHTFLATSPIHMKYKLKMTPEHVLDTAVSAVRYAKRLTEDVEFSPEDAARSDFEFLCRVVEKVISAGARTVNIPDTVGYALPVEFGNLIKKLKEKVPNIDQAIISVHCHNDLGLATANSLQAVLNGARQIECTVNGLGERAGNAALEEIVMTLVTRRKIFDFVTRINSREITKTSRLVSRLTGIPVQPNKAIVGSNAFAHESGIHQHGVLCERLTYEIMTPQSVGLRESKLVLGKHSGKHAFISKLKAMGYSLPEKQVLKVFTRFKDLADKKKEIFDDDLIALVEEEISVVPEVYSLEYLQTTAGTKTISTATVRLKKKTDHQEEITRPESGCGDGPVDATYKAIDRLTGTKGKLLDYSLRALSKGKDAVGEVTARVLFSHSSYWGKGSSTDIIEASAKAYLNAVNKALVKKERLGD